MKHLPINTILDMKKKLSSWSSAGFKYFSIRQIIQPTYLSENFLKILHEHNK